jgi:hypothetical protein
MQLKFNNLQTFVHPPDIMLLALKKSPSNSTNYAFSVKLMQGNSVNSELSFTTTPV